MSEEDLARLCAIRDALVARGEVDLLSLLEAGDEVAFERALERCCHEQAND